MYCNLGKGNRNKNKTKELYKIKPRSLPNGYQRIYARNTVTNKRQDLYIHRLVAQAYVPNPYNKRVVNHKNCNRADNRASNLEWVTTTENIAYAMQLNHLVRDTTTGRFVSGL